MQTWKKCEIFTSHANVEERLHCQPPLSHVKPAGKRKKTSALVSTVRIY